MRKLMQHMAQWGARLKRAPTGHRPRGVLAIALTLVCLLGTSLSGCYARAGYGYGPRSSGYYNGGYYSGGGGYYRRSAPPPVVVYPRGHYRDGGYRGRSYYRAPAARPRHYDRSYDRGHHHHDDRHRH